MGRQNGDRYRQVVAIQKWSLAQVWLYLDFDFVLLLFSISFLDGSDLLVDRRGQRSGLSDQIRIDHTPHWWCQQLPGTGQYIYTTFKSVFPNRWFAIYLDKSIWVTKMAIILFCGLPTTLSVENHWFKGLYFRSITLVLSIPMKLQRKWNLIHCRKKYRRTSAKYTFPDTTVCVRDRDVHKQRKWTANFFLLSLFVQPT